MKPRTDAPRLWVATARPDGLVTALVVAVLTKERFATCHLIHEQSPAWERADWEIYRSHFAGVHPMAKVRAVRGLLDARRYVNELRRRQRALAALHIGAHDTILCLGSTTNLANALASAYPAVAKVLCLSAQLYADACRPPYLPGFRHTTAGWFQYRLLDQLGGVHRALHLKRRYTGGDGARLQRLRKDLRDVFESIVVLSNDGCGRPPDAGPRVFDACFPGPAELAPLQPRQDAPSGRIVVFFGTPFLLVRNLDPHHYAAILNGCLDYLRRHHGARCRLVYRPHPAETSERRLLRLRDFVPQVDLEAAELYLLRNSGRIEAVYSVASTVSRTAFHYGLNGYAFWRCFPFVPPASTFFGALMGRVPAPFEVHSLDEPPVPYANQPDSGGIGPSFAGGINAALDAARRIVAEKGFARAGDPPL